MKSKLKMLWSVITGSLVFDVLTAIYKAVYLLGQILDHAITTATNLNLDASAIVKINKYVLKIVSILDSVAGRFNIALDSDYITEVKGLVTTHAKTLRVNDDKTVKLSDVVDSYDVAFNKLNDILSV